MTTLTAQGPAWLHPFRRWRMLAQVWLRVRVNQHQIARAFPRTSYGEEGSLLLRLAAPVLAMLAAPRRLPAPIPAIAPAPTLLIPEAKPVPEAKPETDSASLESQEATVFVARDSTPVLAAKKDPPAEPVAATTFTEQLTPADHRKIHNRLEAWRAAWSERDIETYAQQLHPRFSEAHGTKRETFLILQKSAFLSRSRILVRFQGAAAIRLAARDLVRAQVRLDYEEDGAGGPRKSQSTRTVWLRKENDEWLISKI